MLHRCDDHNECDTGKTDADSRSGSPTMLCEQSTISMQPWAVLGDMRALLA
jgi:hypothetical protein